MSETKFRKINNVIGWLLFSVALITYGLTVEPTSSYWDAGEYISTSAKLQVGHPPGAPFYQMMGAIFALFASDNESIAIAVNFLSVVSSAFVILFLFWSTTLFLQKIFRKNNFSNSLNIILSASIGALAFMFSDSFWFNAVESEVYALAMLFLSATFWTGLRWEKDFDNVRGDRWLLLVAFLIGLSFGAKTSKMSQGHRGANHPVKNLSNNKVEITSQNHGYMIDKDTLPECLEITHLSLFDGSIEGFKHKSLPIFSVQYHPEASPGPTESSYLFQEFLNLIEVSYNAKTM